MRLAGEKIFEKFVRSKSKIAYKILESVKIFLKEFYIQN